MIFLGSSVLTSHWLLCITCFTSFVSFTDVYSEYVSKGEKNDANVFPTPPITPPPPRALVEIPTPSQAWIIDPSAKVGISL